ncbi:MAG: hypothetical protein KDE47_17985, partial [Caldilineaceae bacterium]|nr:hypothetical protein [Caldilineaceae bacterium]
MILDNSHVGQITDRTIFRLFQQLQDEIAALDKVATTVAGTVTATAYSTVNGARPDGDLHLGANSEEIFVNLQRSLESQKETLHQSSRRLQERVNQLEMLYAIANQYGDATNTDHVLATAMDAIWQKIPLRFLVVILGESELGPYHYHAMRGVASAFQYVRNSCPFPLWGILARALLPRLDPDEPDYLIVKNIADENLPLVDEFPWMPRTGSLMILPLRVDKRARGAILLGGKQANA